MRGYLRLGARICGEPAHDPDFGVGDFPALLDKRQADTRYLRRLRSVSAATEAAGRWPDERPSAARPRLAATGDLRHRVHARRRLPGHPAADRGAAGRAADQPCWLLLAPALPLLAGVMPGWSKSRQIYCRLLLWCLGVKIAVSGGPIRNLPGVLVVSDHRSWLDILTIGAALPSTRWRASPLSFVARADVAASGAVQMMARIVKVIPIERASLRQLPEVVATVAARLYAGHTVVAFPEGTTWCGLSGRSHQGSGRSTRPCSRPPSTPAGPSSRCGCATSTGTAACRPFRPISATTPCWPRSAG